MCRLHCFGITGGTPGVNHDRRGDVQVARRDCDVNAMAVAATATPGVL